MLSLVMLMAGIGGTSPVGNWMNADKDAIIHIQPCPNHPANLCGRIATILDPSEAQARDDHNPNPALRARAVLGLEILNGFAPTAAGWSNGSIYDPEEGRLYSGLNLRMDGRNRLVISKPANLLLFNGEVGRQTWTRADP
ncbi:DUF2147 domain-containing protein [Asticcacaulis sp. 201]|uniref:DUF2147 domain-containing protein n=1 Tax=Asticcacaulis sp. 201 TaxID=3028787 RepID=UPI002916AF14|nr:DUF2147 domain-containing protein [Asticcacaulis sp. 201]MDV6330720.1 DUF2147 domain-containing protein [Asticcacaulis sp. 201]